MAFPDILERASVRLYRAPRGLGDALFVSTVAREIKKRRPDGRVIVETHWPQVFYNNPDVAAVFPAGNQPGEGAIPVGYEDPWPPERRHVLDIICRRLGLDSPDIRPY